MCYNSVYLFMQLLGISELLEFNERVIANCLMLFKYIYFTFILFIYFFMYFTF